MLHETRDAPGGEGVVWKDGVKDVVCWNVMIDGYAQHGCPYGALVPFRKMMMMHGNGNGKVRPNEITIEVVLLVHWSVEFFHNIIFICNA